VGASNDISRLQQRGQSDKRLDKRNFFLDGRLLAALGAGAGGGLLVARLFLVLRSERLVVLLLGRLDQVERVRLHQEVAEVHKLRVRGVLDWRKKRLELNNK